jgi:hypothetical protein
MFDDLRPQEDDNLLEDQGFEVSETQRLKGRQFLGMTPPQRLLIAVMLLTWVCMMSFFVLFLMDKIMPF